MAGTDDATNIEAPDSFAARVATLKKGVTEREASEALQKLVATVLETQKPGSITLKLDIKPAKDVPGMVVVTDQISVKLPHLDRKAEMFFADDNGHLSKDDPRQQSLALDMNQGNTNR
ncbi:MAG: hypothetical protein HOQ21_09990 [Dermatophilaceae bacterium]|nr:hypothetical protein [Dermatophilaceae bacterium]